MIPPCKKNCLTQTLESAKVINPAENIHVNIS